MVLYLKTYHQTQLNRDFIQVSIFQELYTSFFRWQNCEVKNNRAKVTEPEFQLGLSDLQTLCSQHFFLIFQNYAI